MSENGKKYNRLIDGPQDVLGDDERFPPSEGWRRTRTGWVKVFGSGYGKPPRTTGDRLWAERVCRPLSIPPEQATPERIARENAEAKHHGTGVVYDNEGNCHPGTRRNEARETRRRKLMNADAGYSDWAGR